MEKNEVNTAFEILLEALNNEKTNLSNEGKEAMEVGDFRKSKVISEMGEKIEKFYKKIKELKGEWQNIFSESLSLKLIEKRTKLKKGLRTKEEEYYLPILETLVELGGSGKMKNVLEKVFDKMKNKLNKYDLEHLPSDPKQVRWKNAAQWARNAMVKKGYLSSNTSKGIWEITQKGKDFYNQNKNNSL